MRLDKRLLLLAAVAVALSLASASVFVYYPIQASLSFVEPPVKLQAGSNAGQADLAGNTITVSIGANQTSATITLHPTYQTTYYKNILNITNTDTNAYYINLLVSGSLTLEPGEKVYVIIHNSDYSQETVLDLTTSSSTGWITLDAGSTLYVDIQVVYPEGQQLPSTAQTISFNLVYSTQNSESPPTPVS